MNYKIRLAGEIVYDSIVDGTGLRSVIYTQGCKHACSGCHNPQTWALGAGTLRDIESIASDMKGNSLNTHVTFSGGDPFEQSEPCMQLVALLRAAGKTDIWAYTGYTWEELTDPNNKNFTNDKFAFLKSLDVLVDGKYESNNHSYNILYRGSTNQRIIDVPKSLASSRIVLRPEMEK